MVKRLLLSTSFIIFLIISLVYTTPSDTLNYKQRKRRKAPAAYLDAASGAQRIVNIDHSYIHNYQAYSISIVDTLADSEVVGIAFHIPDTIEFHLKFVRAWGEGSPFLAIVGNNPDTIRLSTDTLGPQNRNQAGNIGNPLFPSGCTVTDSVDTIGISNLLVPWYFGGGTGTGQTTFAGTAPSAIEWVLKNDYLYIGIQNLSGNPQKASLLIFWYEIEE